MEFTFTHGLNNYRELTVSKRNKYAELCFPNVAKPYTFKLENLENSHVKGLLHLQWHCNKYALKDSS